MRELNNIDEVIAACLRDEAVAFVLTAENKWTLFRFCLHQLRHPATKDFHKIVYAKKKDALYYMLRLVSMLSVNHYQLEYRGLLDTKV
jgi:hypothetical protein